MSKEWHLVCQAYSTPEYDSDYDHAVLHLTQDACRYLLKHRPLFEDLNGKVNSLYCFEMFDYQCEWGNVGILAGDDDGWLLAPGPVKFRSQGRTDCDTLKVTDSGVLWEARPKHADSGEELGTCRLEWPQIERMALGQNPDFSPLELEPEDSDDDSPVDQEIRDDEGPIVVDLRTTEEIEEEGT